MSDTKFYRPYCYLYKDSWFTNTLFVAVPRNPANLLVVSFGAAQDAGTSIGITITIGTAATIDTTPATEVYPNLNVTGKDTIELTIVENGMSGSYKIDIAISADDTAGLSTGGGGKIAVNKPYLYLAKGSFDTKYPRVMVWFGSDAEYVQDNKEAPQLIGGSEHKSTIEYISKNSTSGWVFPNVLNDTSYITKSGTFEVVVAEQNGGGNNKGKNKNRNIHAGPQPGGGNNLREAANKPPKRKPAKKKY